jgi:hypothetical protein
VAPTWGCGSRSSCARCDAHRHRRIAELQSIRETNGVLAIGAGVPLNDGYRALVAYYPELTEMWSASVVRSAMRERWSGQRRERLADR